MLDQPQPLTDSARTFNSQESIRVVKYDASRRSKPPTRILRKGDACTSCRRKKKRCDSVRPACGTCQASRTAQPCQYEHDGDAGALRWVNSKSGKGTDVPLKSSRPPRQPTPRRDLTPSSSRTASSASSSSPVPQLSLSPTSSASGEIFPLAEHTALVSADDTWESALSSVSPGDLNMDFRLIFLTHRLKFALYFPTVKQQAIFMGDMSGTFIDPFFIHFAHMIGCYLYQDLHNDFSLLYTGVILLKRVHEALGAIPADDPISLAQAYHLLSLACQYINLPHPSKEYAGKSAALVNKHKLRFLPENKEVKEYSLTEELFERIILLGQILSTDVNRFLVTEKSDLKLRCPDLERQFREELPVLCPSIFEICPITLRVQSALVAKDAGEILARCNQEGAWSQSSILTCQSLIASLQRHIDHLSDRLTLFTRITPGSDFCVSLRYSIIVCLASEAETFELLARKSSSSQVSQELQFKSQECLEHIVETTRRLPEEDLRYLDPFLGICWSRAMLLLLKAKEFWTCDPDYVDMSVSLISRYRDALVTSLTNTNPGEGIFRVSIVDLECMLPHFPSAFRNSLKGIGF